MNAAYMSFQNYRVYIQNYMVDNHVFLKLHNRGICWNPQGWVPM